jgi:hypothetical protein
MYDIEEDAWDSMLIELLALKMLACGIKGITLSSE